MRHQFSLNRSQKTYYLATKSVLVKMHLQNNLQPHHSNSSHLLWVKFLRILREEALKSRESTSSRWLLATNRLLSRLQMPWMILPLSSLSTLTPWQISVSKQLLQTFSALHQTWPSREHWSKRSWTFGVLVWFNWTSHSLGSARQPISRRRQGSTTWATWFVKGLHVACLKFDVSYSRASVSSASSLVTVRITSLTSLW